MKITDDVISQNVLDKIFSVITGPNFPWYLQKSITKDDGNFQFTHQLCTNEGVMSSLDILFDELYAFIGIKELMRSKINLLYRTNKIKIFELHNDFGLDVEPYKTAIFYFNTNNGYTLFSDGTKVDSVKNRLVQFDGYTSHTGTTHTSDERFRLVLNINYR